LQKIPLILSKRCAAHRSASPLDIALADNRYKIVCFDAVAIEAMAQTERLIYLLLSIC
jgi:hypothetical protein